MSNRIIPESELVLNNDGSVYHLHLKPEQVADTVILVGDQGRVPMVSSFFDEVEFTISNREFITHTGHYKGQRFTVLSTGIGTDNIDIVLNELDAAVNIDLKNRTSLPQKRSLNLIRLGTSGAIHEDIPVDSVVISTHGLGFEGLIYYYHFQFSPEEAVLANKINSHLRWNPRMSEPYVVAGSKRLLDLLSPGRIPGITATATGFYGPQGRELNLKLENLHLNERLRTFHYNNHRIANFEMETSALYGLGKMMGHHCCTCCAIIANRVIKQYSKDYRPVLEKLIQDVLNTLADQAP